MPERLPVDALWVVFLYLLGTVMRIWSQKIEGNMSEKEARKKVLICVSIWLVICIGFTCQPVYYYQPGCEQYYTKEEMREKLSIARGPWLFPLIPASAYLYHKQYSNPWVRVNYFPSGTIEYSCSDGYSCEKWLIDRR